jgi:hypothetical protein
MKNLNDLFKKKLAEQQFEDKDKHWAQLEKKLTENVQEKVVIAWYNKWLLPLIAIVTIGITALIYNRNVAAVDKVKAVNTKQSNQLSSAQEVASTPPSKNEIVLAENVAHTSPIANNQSNTADLNTQPKENAIISKSINKSINTTKAIQQKAEKSSSPLVAINNSPNLGNASKSVTTNGFLQSKDPVLTTTEFEESNANAMQESNTASAETQKSIKAKTEDPDPYIVDRSTSSSTNNTYKTLDFSQVELPLAYLSPKALSALIYPETNASINANLLAVKASQSKLFMNLSIYGGAMYSMNQLMTSEGNTSNYLSRRKSEETNIIKPNVGIDLELKRGHWTLTSGLNFNQQGEKRNYKDQFNRMLPYDSLVININNNSAWLVDSTMFYALQYNSIIISHDTTVTYYDQASGLFYTAILPLSITQSTIIDTNYYYTTDSTYNQAIDTIKTNYELKKLTVINDPTQANLKGRNTFSYFEIPVLIGYEWGLKRWRLSLKGGIGLGMLTRQQSYYLTSDEAEVAPVSTAVYTKIMYNGILRVGAHYNFTPQFGIDIVPFTRVNINNMTNKNAPFKQKYNNVGLQVGFSYKL